MFKPAPIAPCNCSSATRLRPRPSHFDFSSSQFNPFLRLRYHSQQKPRHLLRHGLCRLPRRFICHLYSSASPVGFAPNSITPGSMANSGPVSLQISGDQLAPNDTFTLSGPGGSFAAVAVQSPALLLTVAYATFNLAAPLPDNTPSKSPNPAERRSPSTRPSSPPPPRPERKPSLSLQLEIPQPTAPPSRFQRLYCLQRLRRGGHAGAHPRLDQRRRRRHGIAGQHQLSDLRPPPRRRQLPRLRAGTLTPGKSWTIPFSAFSANGGNIPFGESITNAGRHRPH